MIDVLIIGGTIRDAQQEWRTGMAAGGRYAGKQCRITSVASVCYHHSAEGLRCRDYTLTTLAQINMTPAQRELVTEQVERMVEKARYEDALSGVPPSTGR